MKCSCRHIICLKITNPILSLRKKGFWKLVVLYNLVESMEAWTWQELLVPKVFLNLILILSGRNKIFFICFVFNKSFMPISCVYNSDCCRRCGIQAEQIFASWQADCYGQPRHKNCMWHMDICSFCADWGEDLWNYILINKNAFSS